MYRVLLIIGLLSFSHPAHAEEKSADYCQVELRGTLQFDADKHELLDAQAIDFKATAAGQKLSFGDNKELFAAAEKLAGKKVIIQGGLGVWSPQTAGPPRTFVPYVRVLSIRAAEDAALEKSPEAAALVKGIKISATLTQAIGGFTSPGRPAIGDAFELDFDNLPQEVLRFTAAASKPSEHYIAIPAPLEVVHVKQNDKPAEPRRTVIHIAATSGDDKLLILVMADSLEKGSKVRLHLYRTGGFVGSMAEAEGVVK